MRIGRLEFGVWEHLTPEEKFIGAPLYEYSKSCCGCRILSLWIFYFTWLGNYCYNAIKEGKGLDDDDT